MPSPDQMKADQTISPLLRDMLKALPQPDIHDLERRIADLEDRARKQDQGDASKERLRKLGLVFPAERP